MFLGQGLGKAGGVGDALHILVFNKLVWQMIRFWVRFASYHNIFLVIPGGDCRPIGLLVPLYR